MLIRTLIFSLMFIGAAAAIAEESAAPSASAWRFDLGVGVEARWRREVNPAFGQYANAPQAFATIWYHRFALSTELSREPVRSSTSGGLTIQTQATRFGTFARYGLLQWGTVTPYVAFGGGATWDTVTTRFTSTVDRRRGSRRFLGAGLGVSAKPWSWSVIEAEARVLSEETVKFPGFGVIVRLGVSF